MTEPASSRQTGQPQVRRIRLLGVLGEYPEDELALRRSAMTVAAPAEADLLFAEVAQSVYRPGLTHRDRAAIAPYVAQAALDGQRAGADAVVPYGTLDLGVEASRHVVDIPVVGPGQTAALVAASMASQFVVLVYDEPHVVMQRGLLLRWSVADRVTSIRAVDVPITEMAAGPDVLRARFVEVARRAVAEEGAQLVVPMGMTMVPVLMSAESLAADIGVPVLDPLALALAVATSLARTGVTNSRLAYPRTADAASRQAPT